jgi:hypothetical protein
MSIWTCAYDQDRCANESGWIDVDWWQAAEADIASEYVVRDGGNVLCLWALQCETEDGRIETLQNHSLHNGTVELTLTGLGARDGSIVDTGIETDVGARACSKGKAKESACVTITYKISLVNDPDLLTLDMDAAKSDIREI